MPVVLLLAAAAVVAATVVLATGRGGELREPVMEPLPTGLPEDRLPTGDEAAALHLPKGLWGYHPATTDEAVHRLAQALTRREEEVAELRALLAERDGHRAGGEAGSLRAEGEGSAWASEKADSPWFEKSEEGGRYDVWPFARDGSGPGGEGRA